MSDEQTVVTDAKTVVTDATKVSEGVGKEIEAAVARAFEAAKKVETAALGEFTTGVILPSFKTRAVKVVGIVALVVGAYAYGRFGQPAKVVTTEKVVTVAQTQTVTTVDTQRVLDAIADVKKTVKTHKVVVVDKKPTGETTTTITTDSQASSDSQAQTQNKTNTAAQTQQTQIIYKDREVTKTVTDQTRPGWSLELDPGIDFAALAGRTTYSLLPSTGNPILHYTVIGASVQKRLFGPLYGGVWANTSGAGGLTLRLDL
jgi:hypothetical protein